MTPKDIRRYNRRTAHPAGKHMCTKCCGIYPRTPDYFYRSSQKRKDGSISLMSWCKACRDQWATDYSRTRYRDDPDFRARILNKNRAYRESLSPRGRAAMKRKYNQRRRERQLTIKRSKHDLRTRPADDDAGRDQADERAA